MTAIRPLGADEPPPWDLLLDADPSRDLVEQYLQNGETFILEDDGVIGVILLLDLGENLWEIKNIAVDPQRRGEGLAKQMLAFGIARARDQGARRLRIATGNSSVDAIALYQKVGFRLTAIDRDFFPRNGYGPIQEFGIDLRDMVILEMTL